MLQAVTVLLQQKSNAATGVKDANYRHKDDAAYWDYDASIRYPLQLCPPS